MIDRSAMRMAAFAALTLGVGGVAEAAWTFTDGEFLQADWTNSVFATGEQGLVSVLHQPDGGNDGRYLSYEMTTNGGFRVQATSFNDANVYDPSVEGAIQELAFSFTTRQLMGHDTTLNSWLAVEQDGTLFLFIIDDQDYDGSNWMIVNDSGLTAENFSAYNPTTGDFEPSSDPDFSENGSAIRFGIFELLDNFQGQEPIVQIDDYDNFSIRITNIPAPGSIALLGLAGLTTLRRRR